jgi:Zn-finger nucleic acid-binding protein
MNCPRCKTELRAIELPEFDAEKVHMCDRCEGAWYSHDSLTAVATADFHEVESSELEPGLEPDKLDLVELDDPVACPECDKKMARFSYSLSPSTLLDECPEHGVWLDDGELGVILDQMALRNARNRREQNDIEDMREKMGLDAIADGSPYNPFAITLRFINNLFDKRRRHGHL